MIKILFSDLDGTLLEKKQGDKLVVITDENKRALQKLKDNNITFCISSGRNIHYVEMVKEEIGTEDCDAISCNGAIVEMSKKRENHFMSPDDVKLLAEYVYNNCDRTKLRMAAVDEDCIYYADYFDEYFMDKFGSIYRHSKDITIKDYLNNPNKFHNYQKIYVMIIDEQYEYWQNHFREKFSSDLDFGCSYPFQMEFMHLGVNKGNAIEWFMNNYGLTLDEVAAIGDADNDRPMLEKVKYSFVVERGEETVKKIAYKVTINFAECVDYLIEYNKKEKR